MIDIQSPTAEIRQGKEEERRRNHSMKKIYMACPITQGGHKVPLLLFHFNCPLLLK